MFGRGPISSTPISGDASVPALTAVLRVRARGLSSPSIGLSDASEASPRALDSLGPSIRAADLSDGG